MSKTVKSRVVKGSGFNPNGGGFRHVWIDGQRVDAQNVLTPAEVDEKLEAAVASLAEVIDRWNGLWGASKGIRWGRIAMERASCAENFMRILEERLAALRAHMPRKPPQQSPHSGKTEPAEPFLDPGAVVTTEAFANPGRWIVELGEDRGDLKVNLDVLKALNVYISPSLHEPSGDILIPWGGFVVRIRREDARAILGSLAS